MYLGSALTKKQLKCLDAARKNGVTGIGSWDYGSTTISKLRKLGLIVKPESTFGRSGMYLYFAESRDHVWPEGSPPARWTEDGGDWRDAAGAFHRALSREGHTVHSQGVQFECSRCGKSCTVVPTPIGALLVGTLAQGEPC